MQGKRGKIDNQMNLRQQSYGSLGRQTRQSLDNNTNVPQDTYYQRYETVQSQDQDEFLRDVLKCRELERESLQNDFNYLYDKIHRIKEKINAAQSAAGDSTTSTNPQFLVPSGVSQTQKEERSSSSFSHPLQAAEIIQAEQIAPSNQLSAEQISANEMLSKWLQLPNSQLNEDSDDGLTQQRLENNANIQWRSGKLTDIVITKPSKEVSQTHKRMQDILSEMNVDYAQILPEIDPNAQNYLKQDNSSPRQSQNVVVLDDISIINIQKLIIAKLSKKADEIKAEKELLASRLISQSQSSFQTKKQSPAVPQ